MVSVEERFCRLLKRMIVDETKAPGEYKVLYNAGVGMLRWDDLDLISSNSGDEKTHKIRLKAIEKKYCRVK